MGSNRRAGEPGVYGLMSADEVPNSYRIDCLSYVPSLGSEALRTARGGSCRAVLLKG